eukprot:TRINITY_DN2225_c0_g1_i1.p2 TRINITY_DN2225_c0_g1~~TRINITY_DN2225_c0_g1_i1.p2  ORF type:complete len:418 (-),score=147.91 TRINITY_DN2225_c0_g1_i1:1577-2791(-)
MSGEDVVMEGDEKGPESQTDPQVLALHLADLEFSLSLPDALCSPAQKQAAFEELLVAIKEHKMAPYYKALSERFSAFIKLEEALYNELVKSNTEELEKLEHAIKDAVENLGETEVRDAHYAKAKFYDRIGDTETALKIYEEAYEKTVGTGQKIDLVFDIIRMGFARNNLIVVRTYISKAKGMVDQGGDWERRNRLKVYEGTYFVLLREFKEASKLFLDSIATFTCTELYDYNRFVLYTILACMISVDRVTLRDKLVQSPDVLSVIADIPYADSFLHSFYKCNYGQFFRALVGIMGEVAKDRYLSAHQKFYLREIRIVVYSQFLQSYKSVTLLSMAQSFGVSVNFLDNDLSQFIAAGKLTCKIDKVRGIVESTRLDAKNQQYQTVIKQGDVLLNRIQKLARVITY